MNQVPWRRILERAGDEEPEESGASVINLQDRMPERQRGRRRPEPRAPQAPERPVPNLESELEYALDQVQREEREKAAARAARPRREPPPAPRAEPAYRADKEPGRMRVPHPRSAPMRRPDLVPPPVAPAPEPRQSKGGNGAKNLLAISLSAAVIGFAFYQIGNQWSETTGGPTAQEEPNLEAASLPAFQAASTASTETARPGEVPGRPAAAFEGNRINLRPSPAAQQRETPQPEAAEADVQPAPETEGTSRQAVLRQDIQEASRLFNQQESREEAASPATGASLIDNSATEQSMLERGHKLLEQGHLAGARLIFEHLAEKQSPLGAFALAQSYDPNYLQSQSIQDSTADAELAARWYQRAAELTEATASR